MYWMRLWNHDRDEMTEEFVEALARIAIDGCVSVTWVREDEVSPSAHDRPQRRTEVRAVIA